MAETAEPFADDGIDLHGIELIRDRLHAGGVLVERMPLSSGS